MLMQLCLCEHPTPSVPMYAKPCVDMSAYLGICTQTLVNGHMHICVPTCKCGYIFIYIYVDMWCVSNIFTFDHTCSLCMSA